MKRGHHRSKGTLSPTKHPNTKRLSSVAWVNRVWVAAVFLLVVTINLISGLFVQLESFWPLVAALVLMTVVLSYPYYHYRISGGFIKRIPPRFAPQQVVFEEAY